MLCLHGFNTNSNILRYQTKSLQKAFGDVIDFHFINAPHHSPADPFPEFEDIGFRPPYYTWWLGGHLLADKDNGRELAKNIPDKIYGIEESVS